MPYPNMHSARVKEPDLFERIVVLKTTSDGVMIYGGPLKSNPSGGTTSQAFRFPKDKFTPQQAKKWLSDNNIKYMLFEAASGDETEKGNAEESVKGTVEFGTEFLEATFDKENIKINGVVLLNTQSSNNREYTRECMMGAVKLFEGVKAYVNHPSTEETKTGRRDVRNLAGKYINARFSEGKIRADFIGLPNENGKLYLDIAKTMPDIAGNSQHAEGKFRISGGKQIVESLERVRSVDLVAEPAATAGMFESNISKEKVMEYKDITIATLKENRSDLYSQVLSEGSASRDDEVKQIKESRDSTAQKLDLLEAEKAVSEKGIRIEKILKESKLPVEAVTEVFRKTLLSITESKDSTLEKQAQALIEDRIVFLKPAGVRNMGGGGGGSGTEVTLEAAHQALTQKG